MYKRIFILAKEQGMQHPSLKVGGPRPPVKLMARLFDSKGNQLYRSYAVITNPGNVAAELLQHFQSLEHRAAAYHARQEVIFHPFARIEFLDIDRHAMIWVPGNSNIECYCYLT